MIQFLCPLKFWTFSALAWLGAAFLTIWPSSPPRSWKPSLPVARPNVHYLGTCRELLFVEQLHGTLGCSDGLKGDGATAIGSQWTARPRSPEGPLYLRKAGRGVSPDRAGSAEEQLHVLHGRVRGFWGRLSGGCITPVEGAPVTKKGHHQDYLAATIFLSLLCCYF